MNYNKSLYAIRVFLFYLLAALGQQVPAQPLGGLTGEVSGMPPHQTHYVVEMRPTMGGGNQVSEKVLVEPNGRFHFWRVAPGQYELTVLGPDDKVLAREFVAVGGDMAAPVQLRLRNQRSGQAVQGSSEPVSWNRLTHRIPKAARKALDRATALRRKGRSAEAELSYLEAIRRDEQFTDAHNDLGTLYYGLRRPADALRHLERARALEPASPKILANTGAALIALGRPADAEPLARRAVASDPTSTPARYLLGLSRAAQQKYDRETRELLEESAAAIPHAGLALAYLYTATGDRIAARQALERYLGSGRAEQRPQIERWLNSLR